MRDLHGSGWSSVKAFQMQPQCYPKSHLKRSEKESHTFGSWMLLSAPKNTRSTVFITQPEQNVQK